MDWEEAGSRAGEVNPGRSGQSGQWGRQRRRSWIRRSILLLPFSSLLSFSSSGEKSRCHLVYSSTSWSAALGQRSRPSMGRSVIMGRGISTLLPSSISSLQPTTPFILLHPHSCQRCALLLSFSTSNSLSLASDLIQYF